MGTGSTAAAGIEAHLDHIVGKHKVAMPNWKHKVAARPSYGLSHRLQYPRRKQAT
jgi:hypothetical protein